MTTPLFADISSNNSEFIAELYRAAGHVLVAIKATEGVNYVDPPHHSRTIAALNLDLAVIHYHFARPDLGTDPEAEAQHFLRTALPLADGRAFLAVDIERATPQGWSHDPAWTFDFAQYVHAHSRFFVILYASRSTLQQSGLWLPNEPKRVWDADWSATPDFAPEGYVTACRQFTDGVLGPEPHSCEGIGECDMNIARRDLWREVLHAQPRR